MKHGERQHALLSASGAKRWMNCTPSARLEESFGKDNDSIYAQEGTLAHEFADAFLRKWNGGLKTRSYNTLVKKLKENKLYSPEMDKEVEKYTSIVIEEFKVAKKKTKDAILSIEEKLDLTDYIEDGFGTGDACIIADDTLIFRDLKYGKGLKVYAEENPQLMLYALGALAKFEVFYDIKKVDLGVIQPRLDHFDTWTISVEDLKAWAAKEVIPSAKKAYAGEGLQVAGTWCQFCKVAPKCSTLAARNLEVIDDEFRDPHLLTDKQLIEVYQKMDQISKWIKSVGSYMLKEALAGKPWEGLKIVEGRSNRKWVDEIKVAEELKALDYTEEQIMNIKLQGITAIEKLLGKKYFTTYLTEHVTKPKGAPSLVNESDPRPIFSDAASEFGLET